jgi:erythromycin esterase
MKNVGRRANVTALLAVLIVIFGCTRKTGAQTDVVPLASHPVTNEADLDVLLNEIGDARVVLLGEATHGTSEFYQWRAAISRRLIEEKGFDFIAVEGEWADSYRLNQFIKGAPSDSASAIRLLKQYDRWPTWMWANTEIASLTTWLNKQNQGKNDKEKAGFFGLDVYCLWESMQELMPYLNQSQPALVTAANKVNACFKPFGEDPQDYANAVANASAGCRQETNNLWQAVSNFTPGDVGTTIDEFAMEQNALVAKNGENYYRAMVSDNAESWNVRDRHMAETLDRLLTFHGSGSRAIVWEHNTHVGDARYTDMAGAGMVNVGQLVREKYGEENVFIVGFGSYEGRVIASGAWGADIQEMKLPAAKNGSWESMVHGNSPTDQIILSREIADIPALQKKVGNRAVGVVYDPRNEDGNYVPTEITRRYDAFFFVDKTTALHPIDVNKRNEPPDTYPSGY